MQPRFVIAAMALGVGAAAFGCQIVAGINGLEAGSGGAGGASSSATSSGSPTSSSTAASSGSSSHAASSSSSSTASSSGSCGLDGGTCMEGSPGNGCPKCSGNVCQPPCNSTMCPNMMIVAGMGPTAMQCTGTTCAGQTFTCSGPYLCELDCIDPGSCVGTKLDCGTSPCRISCGPMACGAEDGGPPPIVTTINCGSDACDAQYYTGPGGMPVLQNCSNSCKCTSKNLGM